MENKYIKYKELEQVSSSLFTLRFYKPEGFIFDPGQFLTLIIKDDEGNDLYRSYSLSSHPEDKYVEMTIKFPEGSRAFAFFDSLSDGDEVGYRGPQGKYVYQENNLEKVHIVTGAGIGPNYSMIKHWHKADAGIPSQLYFGIQKLENIPYLDTLRAWRAEGNFNYYICVSREDGDGVETFTGRVLEVLERTMDDYSNKEFYLCGIPDMVRETITFLQSKNVDADQIHFERFEAARK